MPLPRLLGAAIAALMAGLCAVAGGCPDDPSFGANDTTSETTLSPLGDTSSADVDDVPTRTDLGPDDVGPEDVGLDEASDLGPEIDVGPGCGTTCGPAAECVEATCRCAAADCSAEVAPGVGGMAVTVDVLGQLLIAYGRLGPHSDLNLARWSAEGWSHDTSVAPWVDIGSLGVALDTSLRPHILHSDAALDLYVVRPAEVGWEDVTTGAGPCRYTGLARNVPTGRLVTGCLGGGPGEFAVHDLRADGTFDIRQTNGLVPPKGFAFLTWALADTGITWVAWLAPTDTEDELELELAYLAGETWNYKQGERFLAPRALALTVDRESNPHVFVAHDEAADTPHAALTHVYYKDALNLASAVMDRASGESFGTFAQRVTAGSAGGTRLHLVYNRGAQVVWTEVDGPLAGTPEVFQLQDDPHALRVVGSSSGKPNVILIDDDARLRVWLPLGP